MAQDQTVTDEGIGELVKLWAVGSTGASVMKSIVCLSSTAACTVANTDFYSSTGGAAAVPVTSTGSGLSIASIDAVSSCDTNTTNDTIVFDHVFTCASTAATNVSGIMVLNDDDDCSYVEACFASVIPMESTDTLTIDGAVTIDQAST